MSRAQQVDFLLAGLWDSGNPNGFGEVMTYAAGTTTPKNTYTDAAMTTPAANPIVLDANGVANVYADGRYKFVVKNSAGSTIYTLDNLQYGLFDGSTIFCNATGGTANAQTATSPVPFPSLFDGLTVLVKASSSNSGAMTFSPDGLPPKSVQTYKGALAGGEFIAGNLYELTYVAALDVWLLLNPSATWITNFTPVLSGSGAMTISGVSVTRYEYRTLGDLTLCNLTIAFTTGGTASNFVLITTPFNITQGFLACCYINDSGESVGFIQKNTTNQVSVSKPGGGNFALGAGRNIQAEFFCRS
jgi:hypothetical protein